MPRVIEWNTNRLYDKRGQLIRAVCMPSGMTIFYDLSRQVGGLLMLGGLPIDKEPESNLISLIMHMYDACDYQECYVPDNPLPYAVFTTLRGSGHLSLSDVTDLINGLYQGLMA